MLSHNINGWFCCCRKKNRDWKYVSYLRLWNAKRLNKRARLKINVFFQEVRLHCWNLSRLIRATLKKRFCIYWQMNRNLKKYTKYKNTDKILTRSLICSTFNWQPSSYHVNWMNPMTMTMTIFRKTVRIRKKSYLMKTTSASFWMSVRIFLLYSKVMLLEPLHIIPMENISTA